MQQRDLGAFRHGIGVLCGLALLFILAAVCRQYLQQQLQMLWRNWMTAPLTSQWLPVLKARRQHGRRAA